MTLQKTVSLGGCIRLYDTGPEWHINSHHIAVGFDTTSPPQITPAGDLLVQLDPGGPVVSAIAAPDETLAARGITLGISGAVSTCTVRMSQAGYGRLDLSEPDDYARASGANSNLWLVVTAVAPDEPDPEPEPEPTPPADPSAPGLTIGDLDAAWKALSPNALQALVTVGALLGGSGCGCTCRTT